MNEMQAKEVTAIEESSVEQESTEEKMEYRFVEKVDEKIDDVRELTDVCGKESELVDGEESLRAQVRLYTQACLTTSDCPLIDAEPCSNIQQQKEQEVIPQTPHIAMTEKCSRNAPEIDSCDMKHTVAQESNESIYSKEQKKHLVDDDQIEQQEEYFNNDPITVSGKENTSGFVTEEYRETLQNCNSLPVSSMKVINSHSDMKQSPTFATQSLPVNKFVSRLSKKMEELAPKLKPHTTTPVHTSKCPRNLITTLEDFLSKHRLAEEKCGTRIRSNVTLPCTASLDLGTRIEPSSSIQTPSCTPLKFHTSIQPADSTFSCARSKQDNSTMVPGDSQPSAILQLMDGNASTPSVSPPSSTSTCIQPSSINQPADNVHSLQKADPSASDQAVCSTQQLNSELVIFQSPSKIITAATSEALTAASPSVCFSNSPVTASSIMSSDKAAESGTDQPALPQALCRIQPLCDNQTVEVSLCQSDHTIPQQSVIVSTQPFVCIKSPASNQPAVSSQSSDSTQLSIGVQSPGNTQSVISKPSARTCTQLSGNTQSSGSTQPSINTQSSTSSIHSSAASDIQPEDVEVAEDDNGKGIGGDAPYMDSLLKTRADCANKEDIMNRAQDASGNEGDAEKEKVYVKCDLSDTEKDTSDIESEEDKERAIKRSGGVSDLVCKTKSRRVLNKVRDDLDKENNAERREDMFYRESNVSAQENYIKRSENLSHKEKKLSGNNNDVERKDVPCEESNESDKDTNKMKREVVSCEEQGVSDEGNGSEGEKNVSMENEFRRRKDVSDKDNEGKGESTTGSRKRRRTQSPNHCVLQLFLPGKENSVITQNCHEY